MRARDDDPEVPVTSPVTRRQLIIDGAVGLSAVSFLSTALVACGGDDSSSSSSSSTSGSANKSTKVRVAYTATAFPSIVNNRAGLAYYGKEFGLDVTNADLQTFNDSATATQAPATYGVCMHIAPSSALRSDTWRTIAIDVPSWR